MNIIKRTKEFPTMEERMLKIERIDANANIKVVEVEVRQHNLEKNVKVMSHYLLGDALQLDWDREREIYELEMGGYTWRTYRNDEKLRTMGKGKYRVTRAVSTRRSRPNK